MTEAEARYVLAHRHMYDEQTYDYALEIVEQADRQKPWSLEDRDY